MAAPQNFRSAFNGFNREDVVHYLEYLNTKHTAQVNQLTSEANLLRQKLEQAAPAEDPGQAAQLESLRTQCETLRSRLETTEAAKAELETRCAALEQELRTALAARDQAESDRNATMAQQSTIQCRVEQELEAYRRAERTERLAKERADLIYRQANGVLADATVKVDNAASELGAVADQVMAQLHQLQAAVSGSKQALQDAAATMYSLHSDSEE